MKVNCEYSTSSARIFSHKTLNLKPRKHSDDEFEEDDSLDLEDSESEADEVDSDDEDEEGGAIGGVEDARPRTLTRKEVLDILQSSKNFAGLDLRRANLAKLDFSGCCFAGTNCSYVNFKDANLEACDFSNASLWNANLEGVNLTRANLEDADLDYTKLRGAVLLRANVRRANLPTDLIPRDEIMKSVNDGMKITR